MLLPETGTRSRPRPVVSRLHGWGRGAPVSAVTLSLDAVDAVEEVLGTDGLRADYGGVIVRGAGRSYGDAAQLDGGLVLRLDSLRRVELDERAGTVFAEAGATIGQLLETVVPRGWIVPVVPGTQHVSVGGAIASDIHGKNHGIDGTFGRHVVEIELIDAAGRRRTLRAGEPDRLFEATLGGMGLTGAIVSARIALRRVEGLLLSVDTDRATSLDHVLGLLSGPGGRHRVAWLDLLSRRPRGVVTRAEHLTSSETNGATVRARAEVPTWWPEAALQPAGVRGFNELRFRRSPRRRRGAIERFGSHMFPLDGLACWPRLYGPAGFLQYQFVVPFGQEAALESVIALLRSDGVPVYLAVLKDFGAANTAPLSFPLAGWTLALDIPRSVPGLDAVLDRCDERVVAAGGRVYLSKDARLRPDVLDAMYPELGQWRAIRDAVDPERLWCSDLSRRTQLVGE